MELEEFLSLKLVDNKAVLSVDMDGAGKGADFQDQWVFEGDGVADMTLNSLWDSFVFA